MRNNYDYDDFFIASKRMMRNSMKYRDTRPFSICFQAAFCRLRGKLSDLMISIVNHSNLQRPYNFYHN